jgi:two-component system sensor kinase FixL
VIVNLVENARDALVSSPEARRLSILLSGSNGTATLVIRDNGPGAPADALPRLFEPFFSLKEHGTGLGLAIVKRTIEAHGGSITAAPAGDRGLALQIELPLAPRV